MKLSVSEAKLAGLCYYSTGFDFKICLRARKVSGPFEKQAPEPKCFPQSVSEIVTGDASVSYGAFFFPVPSNSPSRLCES